MFVWNTLDYQIAKYLNVLTLSVGPLRCFRLCVTPLAAELVEHYYDRPESLIRGDSIVQQKILKYR
jgi:hypothetical protein